MSKQIRSLVNSFRAAFSGVARCVSGERNMRIHLSAALGVTLLSLFYPFTARDYVVLALLFAMVISAEMFNTAVEVVVDLFSPAYSHLAKAAKDIAAGAVLICAAAAVLVGLLLFGNVDGLYSVREFFQVHPVVLSAGVVSYLAFALCFIFLPENKKR